MRIEIEEDNPIGTLFIMATFIIFVAFSHLVGIDAGTIKAEDRIVDDPAYVELVKEQVTKRRRAKEIQEILSESSGTR